MPEWLRLLEQEARDTIQFAAIAIHRDRPHIGLIHRRENDEHLSLLHLAWHFDLRNETPAPPDYAWVLLPVSPMLSRLVAAECRLVWGAHENGGLPFGFEFKGTAFEPTTKRLLLGDSAHGLTCATFALAVLSLAGIQLIDLPSWEARPSDQAWQNQIIALLARHGAPAQHTDALWGEVGSMRYRPEEVCAAASLPKRPGTFTEVVPIGEELAEALWGVPVAT